MESQRAGAQACVAGRGGVTRDPLHSLLMHSGCPTPTRALVWPKSLGPQRPFSTKGRGINLGSGRGTEENLRELWKSPDI